MDIFSAIILGIIEGITEALPVSSTGHMILTSSLMGLQQDNSLKAFEVVVQLGGILAIFTLFYKRLLQGIDIYIKVAIGFIPIGICGLTLYKLIKASFNGYTVAIMLIIGGLAFIIVEWLRRDKAPKVQDVDDLTYKQALIIGICQCFSVIPGTSRSGATIIGGLAIGLSRKTAAEFSFLLALPTIFCAVGYDIFKNYDKMVIDSVGLLIVGNLVAFFVTLATVKFFLYFVQRFSYVSFGIYRILVGTLFLYLFGIGVLEP